MSKGLEGGERGGGDILEKKLPKKKKKISLAHDRLRKGEKRRGVSSGEGPLCSPGARIGGEGKGPARGK